MKTFIQILSFLLISLLFQVSGSTGNLTDSEISVENSKQKDQQLQSVANLGIFVCDSPETEAEVSTSQHEILLFSFNELSISDQLLKRSYCLALVQASKLQSYDHDFINKSFNKEIIFPFHSFW